ncbi:ribosomal protein S18-alanine N-acetyltransferase [Glutamicibacter sp. MNS18]|uniref:ribosomal protein S18-alanine N-acetyltransferase n=1 Tax=Glutamicibacter sp. MNS18 TaxID=2989817 RepID=UPI002235E5DD|nr:ribosomal protein S18-alanine N-acetyltransferase [Glutamicibacter sp. MNS18]MCW4464202.1 ribosomal protein S18-alanine N-acetyltransferase [Glutamicibacter sp. MNS18]
MKPVLRTMTAADIPAVHALETATFPTDAWPLELFDAELAQTETRDYWVYEAEKRILGYAGLCTVLPFADVQTIAIHPDTQGHGLGRALMQVMIDKARERRARDVMLEVRKDNPVAIGLYLSLGFQKIHERPKYYRDGTDALIMRLRLRDEEDNQ